MKVKDIMTKEVFCVDINADMSEVAKTLTEKRIHGVPVLKDGKVVGIITETDFFVGDNHSLYLPSFIDFIKEFKFSKGVSPSKNREMREVIKARAEDIMTKGCVSVDPELEIDELLKVFKKEGFNTLPVIDKSGCLCGIITLADIISLVKL